MSHPSSPSQSLPTSLRFLTRLIDFCLYAAIILVPLAFFPWTADVLELPKQTLFGVLMVIGLVAWLGRALIGKQFSLARGWLHMTVSLFVLGYLMIALFSQDRYASFFGSSGQVSWSLTTIVLGFTFYLLSVHHIRSIVQAYHLLLAFLYSSCLVAVLSLLQMMGWYIWPFSVVHSQAFTVVGSIYGLAIYLAPVIVMASALLFHGCRERTCVLGEVSLFGLMARIGVWLTLFTSVLVLLLVDSGPAWATVLFGTVAMVGIGLIRSRSLHRPEPFIIPALLAIISLLFLFFRTPIRLNLPSEVAPSLSASWQIARQTLQEHPLFGSGPGTWIYDYAKYRIQPINYSPFWTTRFDRGFSAFFTLLATVGLTGIILWLLFIISGVIKSSAHVLREKRDEIWYAHVTVFVGWISSVFAVFVYNVNVAHQFAFWFLLALLGTLVTGVPFRWDLHRSTGAKNILTAGFLLVVVGGISVLWLGGQRLVADINFASGFSNFEAGSSIDTVILKLTRATVLNPWSDLYLRNLSQAYLSKAMKAVKNQPTVDQTNKIQGDVTKAVDLGRAAVERTPANVDNWINLGLVYQGIADFTRDANDFAIKNYQQAFQREPNNPVIPGEIGRLYIARADAYQALLSTGDAKARAEAAKNVNENLKQAFDYLQSAIALKSDYLPAHYELGLVYERQSRLPEAIMELEQYLRANNKDVGVAFELAILYYRHNGHDDRARATNLLEQVVKADPSNANAHWYLSFMYEEQGRLEEALEQLEPLLQSFPANVAIQQRIDNLKKAQGAKAAAVSGTLPEPLHEEVKGSVETNR